MMFFRSVSIAVVASPLLPARTSLSRHRCHCCSCGLSPSATSVGQSSVWWHLSLGHCCALSLWCCSWLASVRV